MSEVDDAIKLANRALDRNYGDPDDDLATLARQFLRALERFDKHTESVTAFLSEIAITTGVEDFEDQPRMKIADLMPKLLEAARRNREALHDQMQSEW